jgi:hypothetical protein
LERLEASIADPFPNVMGGDSSSEDTEVAGQGIPTSARETEAQETSKRRPIAVEDVSDDEADSELAAQL